jgi:hypothetical protein
VLLRSSLRHWGHLLLVVILLLGSHHLEHKLGSEQQEGAHLRACATSTQHGDARVGV